MKTPKMQAIIANGPYAGKPIADALRAVTKHELAHALARKQFFGTTPLKLQVNKNGTAFVKEESGSTLRFIHEAQASKDEEMIYNYAVMSAVGYVSEGGIGLADWIRGIASGAQNQTTCADVAGIKLSFSVLGSLKGYNTFEANTVEQKHKLGNMNMLQIKDDPIIDQAELQTLLTAFFNDVLSRATVWCSQNAKKLDDLTNKVIATWGHTPSLNAANLRALLRDC